MSPTWTARQYILSLYRHSNSWGSGLMYMGNLVFSQVMEHLPLHTFRRCVQRYRGNHKIQSFSCLDQFRCMAFAQLTYRESLRDIEACLRAQQNKLYHMGIRGGISRNTLSNANKVSRYYHMPNSNLLAVRYYPSVSNWPNSDPGATNFSVSFGESWRSVLKHQGQQCADTVEKLVNLNAWFFRWKQTTLNFTYK